MQEKQRLREAILHSLWGCDLHKPILLIQSLLVQWLSPDTIDHFPNFIFHILIKEGRNIMVPIPYHLTFLPFSYIHLYERS